MLIFFKKRHKNSIISITELHVKKLSITHFKNHRQVGFEFGNQFNFVTGGNGLGKTNLLDAIYYICTGKSFFSRTDLNSISFEEEFAFVKAAIDNGNETDEIVVALSRKEKKKLLKNGVKIQRLSEHFGYLPVVFLTPAEIGLVNESSKERRKFLDRILGQTDSEYLVSLLKSNKLLESRNELLKMMLERRSYDPLAIEAYDRELAPFMNDIHEKRKEFAGVFAPYVSHAYLSLAGEGELAELLYISDLHEKNAQELFTENQKKDRYSGRTASGIHKDDLEFRLKGRSLKHFGSQGQIKSYVIALHLAAYKYIWSKTDKQPLLLLDDIFEKIDSDRADNLLREIGANGYGQIFISDTDEQRIKSHIKGVKADKKFFKFEAGIQN